MILMTKEEMYNNYLNTLSKRTILESKIENFIEKWKSGNTSISNATVQQVVDKGYERLKELQEIEEKLYKEYTSQTKKEEDKRNADTRVQQNLGVSPTDIEIIGGQLSSNADDSYLIGEQKSKEQLEKERIILLDNIKTKVMNKEISFAEASKMVNDVNNAYDFYDNKPEEKQNESKMNR